MSPRRPREEQPINLPVGTLGTATTEVVIRGGGDQATGSRRYVISCRGEIEFTLRQGTTITARWYHMGDDPPELVTVPGGAILSARRPAAMAAVAIDNNILLTEVFPDGR